MPYQPEIINPLLEVQGEVQEFGFSNSFPNGRLDIISKLLKTTALSADLSLNFKDLLSNGFGFEAHLNLDKTQDTFSFHSILNNQTSPLWTLDRSGHMTLSGKLSVSADAPPPSADTDLATVKYVNDHSGGGSGSSVELTGDVVASGTTGTPIPASVTKLTPQTTTGGAIIITDFKEPLPATNAASILGDPLRPGSFVNLCTEEQKGIVFTAQTDEDPALGRFVALDLDTLNKHFNFRINDADTGTQKNPLTIQEDFLDLNGGYMRGSRLDPQFADELVSKQYVDSHSGGGGGSDSLNDNAIIKATSDETTLNYQGRTIHHKFTGSKIIRNDVFAGNHAFKTIMSAAAGDYDMILKSTDDISQGLASEKWWMHFQAYNGTPRILLKTSTRLDGWTPTHDREVVHKGYVDNLVPVGGVISYPNGNQIPSNYLKCDGSTFSGFIYPTLYEVLQQIISPAGTLPNLVNNLSGNSFIYIIRAA